MLNEDEDKWRRMEPDNGQLYGSVQAAKCIGISIRQLYHWVDRLHIVNPRIERYGLRQYRRFTTSDLETLQKVKVLVDRGYTLRAASEIAKGQREP